jgi:hypothetical protein
MDILHIILLPRISSRGYKCLSDSFVGLFPTRIKQRITETNEDMERASKGDALWAQDDSEAT